MHAPVTFNSVVQSVCTDERKVVEHSSCEAIPKPGYGFEPKDYSLQGYSRKKANAWIVENTCKKGKQSLHPEKRVERGGKAVDEIVPGPLSF